MSDTVLKDSYGYRLGDVMLAVQRGNVHGSKVVWKFGHSSSITTSIEDIWTGDGEYPFPSTAEYLSIVSDSSDTVEIGIQGLDENYDEIVEVVTLTGTTPVQTTNKFMRVNRAYNNDGVNLSGDIAVSHMSNIVAYIHASDNQTLQAIYTIPNGYTGYLFKGMVSTSKGKDVQIMFKFRLFGKVFRISETFGLYESAYEADRPYLPMPEKTDLKVSAISSSSGTDVSAQFGILLIKNQL